LRFLSLEFGLLSDNLVANLFKLILGDFYLMILGIIISGLIFCLFPVIIRFGNCWTELRGIKDQPRSSEEELINVEPKKLCKWEKDNYLRIQ
jgi:hypothetical protein